VTSSWFFLSTLWR